MGWFSKKPEPVDAWRRQPGEIGLRIEAADVRQAGSTRPFVVYDGTVALVFQQGRLLGKLASGKHDIDGSVRRWFVGDHPTVLVLTDAGDITLDTSLAGLYTRENVEVAADLRLTLQIDAPETFYSNVMKDRRRYLEEDLRGHLRPELLDATLAFTSTRAVDHLYHNAGLREELARALEARVGASLSRLGFRRVSVNVVAFRSEHFDRLRGREAEMDLAKRGTDLDETHAQTLKRAREILAEDKKHEGVTGARLESALHQAAHALRLRDALREDEYARLEARFRQDALDFEQQRTQPRERSGLDHDLGLQAKRGEHAREQGRLDADAFFEKRLAEAATGEKVRDVERTGTEKDWDLAKRVRDDALDARRRKQQQDEEHERTRAETLGKTDTATKIALGVGDKEALLEIDRLARQKEMTPEQLLVLAAEKSPAAAAALAERFKAEGKLNDEFLDQLRRQLDRERQANSEHASQLERVLKEALGQMGRVATAKAESQGPGDQTIVTGGGLGPPTVIPPREPPKSEPR